MSTNFTAACIQLNSKRTLAEDVPSIIEYVDLAIAKNADLILLPECTGMMEPDQNLLKNKAPFENEHPILPIISQKASESETFILIGSLAIRLENNKIANRSYLFNSRGEVIATYDKIHLFDVKLNDGQFYQESAVYQPGDKAVTAKIPWGTIGLTICYDVRFPHIYRKLAKANSHFIAIPSAFTKTSGEAHWHVLQRARAIETGCFILAPAQCGIHADNRQTYGHSLIVDPWGKVLADGGEQPGIITAEIDFSEVAAARQKIPSLSHDRNFDLAH